MVLLSLVKQFQILLLFWLVAIVSARDVQTRHDFSPLAWERNSLERRQDSSFEPILDASCRYKCVARSCGDSCAAVTKREYIPLDHAERPYRLMNEESGEWYNVSQEEYHSDLARRGEIYKRAFIIDPRWNTARIRAYLPAQVLPGADGKVQPLDHQFSGSKGFYAGGSEAEVTVSYQVEFGNTAFQLGTGGLHGCTMLTIVSNRAVWMAHFWEAYAFGENEGPLVPGSEDQTNFQIRVLNAMTGTGDQDGSYAEPVDWTQFNQPGDNTRAIFMTPVNPATTQSNPSALYKDRIILIQNLIAANIPGVATQIFRYNPLNYYYDPDTNTYSGPDRNSVDTTERGMAAFQYDGAGNWRLFYEAMMYRNGDAIEDTPQKAFK